MMNRLRQLVASRRIYESVQNEPDGTHYERAPFITVDGRDRNDDVEDESGLQNPVLSRFSWIEYSIFMLLGVAMLWAW